MPQRRYGLTAVYSVSIGHLQLNTGLQIIHCNSVEIQLCTAHPGTRHLSVLQHYYLIKIQLTGKDRGGLKRNIYGLIRLQCLKFCRCEQVQTPITIRGAAFMFRRPLLSKRRWSYLSPEHKTSSATHSTKKKRGRNNLKCF